MGKILANFSISTKIGAVAALPLVAVLVLAGMFIAEKWSTAGHMREIRDFTAFSSQLGAAVHDLQRERGASGVFIGSKGAQLADELPKLQTQSRDSLAALRALLERTDLAAVSAATATAMNEALPAVDQLEATQRQVSGRQIDAAASARYFTSAIAALHEVVRRGAQSVDDLRIAQALTGFYNFTSTKERAGRERATGAPAFGAGSFTADQFRQFMAITAEQNVLLQAFLSGAPRAQVELYRRTVTGPSVAEVERMRKVATEAGAGGSLGGIDGTAWFRNTTDRIDLMRNVEVAIAEDLQEIAAAGARDASHALYVAAGIIGLVLACLVWLAFAVGRAISGPVGRLAGVTAQLADGNLATTVPSTGARDEIGMLARSIDVFREKLVETENLREQQRMAEQSAQEEEKRRETERLAAEENARQERRRALLALADDFEASVGKVVDGVAGTASTMQDSAEQLSATAEETTRQATAVAAASEQASANVQTVAAAAEELSKAGEEIARQIAKSNSVTQSAVAEAQNTDAKIKSLAEAASRVGEVVTLISDIASQTNLLALNATIEAARAGEAGKGFAVVASEVKTLANQTAKATDEISGQIGAIQGATQEAVAAIRTIGATIAEVNDITTSIASAVEEQGAATREIALNVQQAAASAQEVSGNIVGVNQASGETSQVATQVLGASSDMARQAGELREAVAEFLGRVRTA